MTIKSPIIKRILSEIIAILGKTLNYFKLIKPEIMIRMDGGVCSQMHFFLVGEMLRNKGNLVSYDLDWFQDYGKDGTGKFSRDYVLDKLIPQFRINICKSRIKRKLYKFSFNKFSDYFKSDSIEWLDVKGPVYLSGYYHDPEEMYDSLFHSVFNIEEIEVPAEDKEIWHEILNKDLNGGACAIHVRRGDLAEYCPAYGNPPTLRYFEKAISKVKDLYPDITFYIFSDEPDWVKETLSKILKEEKYQIMSKHGSDKGYCDMLLMAGCRALITSQGSLGKYAALLRRKDMQDGMVILSSNPGAELWKNRLENAMIIGLS